AREPESRDLADSLTAASTEVARHDLAKQIPPGPWLDWAARLIPVLTTEAVIAWLDAGQPDPGQAAERIGRAVHGAIQAASRADGRSISPPSRPRAYLCRSPPRH